MWRMMIMLAVLAPLPAQAYSKKQENVLKHLSDAIAVSKLCSTLQFNDAVGAAAMMFYDLGADDMAELETRVSVLMDEMSGTDEEIVCASGKILYGPEGMNVPGLLRQRD